jgi:hypothetical protein
LNAHTNKLNIWLRLAFAPVFRFCEVVPGTKKAQLTLDEVVRIAVSTVSAAGGLFGVLKFLEWNLGPIFPAPIDAAMACAVLTLILETCRRLDQGEDVRHYNTQARRRG